MVMGKLRAKRTTVVLYDSDYGFAMNVFKNLYLEPGDPGPGDEWKFPTEPIIDSGPEDDVTLDRVRAKAPDDPTAKR
jgi:hypothetical protein